MELLALVDHGPLWTETAAKMHMSSLGITVPSARTLSGAVGPAEAVEAAEELGYPVVLKAILPGVAHKSQAGLVVVGLTGRQAVEAAHAELIRAVAQSAAVSDGRQWELLVECHVDALLELVVSAGHDPTFGPVVMFGSGGVQVEQADDLRFRALPITEKAARSLVLDWPLITNLRQRCTGDPVNELAKVVHRVGSAFWANESRWETVELNPVAVLGDGTVMALDALIEARPTK